MLDPREFCDQLENLDIRFYTGVPDSLLKDLCSCITHRTPKDRHIISANEGGAIALGLGYHLATGKIPLVYFQNSGLGNTINPLLSLADPEVYSIPLLLLIGWRGEPGTKDEPQHKKQGRVMMPMLEVMEIPYSILDPETDDPNSILQDAMNLMRRSSRPYAIAVKKGTFAEYSLHDSANSSFELSREDAVTQIIDLLSPRDIVVATTGMLSREVFEYRENCGHGHSRDFLTVGGMGHASQVALGIALQKPDRQVICIDGDGSALMHMGSLAINGVLAPSGFKHVIINNGSHDSVGGQPTVGFEIELPGVARSAGYKTILRAVTRREIKKGFKGLMQTNGPGLLEIPVKKGARRDLGRPSSSPIDNKKAFMEFLK